MNWSIPASAHCFDIVLWEHKGSPTPAALNLPHPTFLIKIHINLQQLHGSHFGAEYGAEQVSLLNTEDIYIKFYFSSIII